MLCRTMLAGALVGATQISLRKHFYKQAVIQVLLDIKYYIVPVDTKLSTVTQK